MTRYARDEDPDTSKEAADELSESWIAWMTDYVRQSPETCWTYDEITQAAMDAGATDKEHAGRDARRLPDERHNVLVPCTINGMQHKKVNGNSNRRALAWCLPGFKHKPFRFRKV
jgi:hypothetical protein